MLERSRPSRLKVVSLESDTLPRKNNTKKGIEVTPKKRGAISSTGSSALNLLICPSIRVNKQILQQALKRAKNHDLRFRTDTTASLRAKMWYDSPGVASAKMQYVKSEPQPGASPGTTTKTVADFKT